MRWPREKPLPIGLDLGTEQIRALQLQVRDGQPFVVSAASEPTPADLPADPLDKLNALVPTVRELLRRGEFRGNKVVMSVPGELVRTKNFRLPPMPAAELDGAVAFEAKSVFESDGRPTLVQHLLAGDVRQGSETKQEVIVFAVDKEPLDRIVRIMHGSGLALVSLDLSPCAVYRHAERFLRRVEDETVVNVLLDVGARQTKIVIGRGRQIGFVKSIEVGAGHVNDAVAGKLSITAAEARHLRQRLADPNRAPDAVAAAVYDTTRGVLETLCREVSLCLRYYSVTFRGQRPSLVRVVGGGANDPSIVQVLAAGLSIPVERGLPVASLNNAERVDDAVDRSPLGEWAETVGLALRTAKGPFAPAARAALTPPRPRNAEVIDLDLFVGASPRVEAAHA